LGGAGGAALETDVALGGSAAVLASGVDRDISGGRLSGRRNVSGQSLLGSGGNAIHSRRRSRGRR
jgi:hypothetical protein